MVEVLEEARGLGFLGPQPVAFHYGHALAFVDAVHSAAVLDVRQGSSFQAMDLGTGGGVPGLVLAEFFPHVHWLLVDSMQRRTTFLRQAVQALGWEDRCEVVRGRAEELGRTALRSSVEVVVARGFGGPAELAECASPFLNTSGRLIVSEPPDSDGARWMGEGLGRCGMELSSVGQFRGFSFAFVVQESLAPDWCPRTAARRARSPLF